MKFKDRKFELKKFIEERINKAPEEVEGAFENPLDPNAFDIVYAHTVVFGRSVINLIVPKLMLRSKALAFLLWLLGGAISLHAKRCGVEEREVKT